MLERSFSSRHAHPTARFNANYQGKTQTCVKSGGYWFDILHFMGAPRGWRGGGRRSKTLPELARSQPKHILLGSSLSQILPCFSPSLKHSLASLPLSNPSLRLSLSKTLHLLPSLSPACPGRVKPMIPRKPFGQPPYRATTASLPCNHCVPAVLRARPCRATTASLPCDHCVLAALLLRLSDNKIKNTRSPARGNSFAIEPRLCRALELQA